MATVEERTIELTPQERAAASRLVYPHSLPITDILQSAYEPWWYPVLKGKNFTTTLTRYDKSLALGITHIPGLLQKLLWSNQGIHFAAVGYQPVPEVDQEDPVAYFIIPLLPQDLTENAQIIAGPLVKSVRITPPSKLLNLKDTSNPDLVKSVYNSALKAPAGSNTFTAWKRFMEYGYFSTETAEAVRLGLQYSISSKSSS